jgi:cysteine-S-conjugate beta-lyase
VAHSAFAFNSGMAALNAVTRLLCSGEGIIASADLYGGMYRLLTRVAMRNGIRVEFVDTSNLQLVREALKPHVKLIHLETPSNPLMKITDLQAVAELAHANGTLLSVDSTMMSPHLQKPLSLGADLVVHSATKFLSGHADVIAGVVCCRTAELSNEIAFYQNAEGTALAPFDCWLLLRSIKTLALRVERAQSNGRRRSTL